MGRKPGFAGQSERPVPGQDQGAVEVLLAVRTDRIKWIGPETGEEYGELLSVVRVKQVRQVGWEGDGLVRRHAGHPDLGESDPAVAEVPLRVALTGGHDLDVEE